MLKNADKSYDESASFGDDGAEIENFDDQIEGREAMPSGNEDLEEGEYVNGGVEVSYGQSWTSGRDQVLVDLPAKSGQNLANRKTPMKEMAKQPNKREEKAQIKNHEPQGNVKYVDQIFESTLSQDSSYSK